MAVAHNVVGPTRDRNNVSLATSALEARKGSVSRIKDNKKGSCESDIGKREECPSHSVVEQTQVVGLEAGTTVSVVLSAFEGSHSCAILVRPTSQRLSNITHNLISEQGRFCPAILGSRRRR